MPNAKAQKPAEQATVRFRFTADRFGYRPGSIATKAGFAKQLVTALDEWEKAVGRLFGDARVALDNAVKARILPSHPKWKDVAEYRSTVGRELGRSRIDSDAELDIRTRYAAEELRLYLEDLYDWAETFQAGAWAAIVAGGGSLATDAQTRSLQGLKTLAEVFGFDTRSERHEVLAELKKLRSAGGSLVPPKLADAVAKRMDKAPQTFGSFAEEPSRIGAWLKSLKSDAEALIKSLSTLRSDPGVWQDVEQAYWRQWRWSSAPVATRVDEYPEVTILDLIYTARHGGIPVVPARGGRLSIGQWSRMFNLAWSSQSIPSDVASIAASNLGIPELANRMPLGKLAAPIVAIRPRSSQSPAWAWGPQPGVRAVMLMPPDVADADRAATVESIGPDNRSIRGETRAKPEDPIEEALAVQDYWRPGGGVGIIEFVELGGDVTVDSVARQGGLRASLDQIFFGYGHIPSDGRPYFEAPRDLPDLLERTRTTYSYLFPLPPPPKGLFGLLIWLLRLPGAMVARWMRRLIITTRRRWAAVAAAYARFRVIVRAARRRWRRWTRLS